MSDMASSDILDHVRLMVDNWRGAKKRGKVRKVTGSNKFIFI